MVCSYVQVEDFPAVIPEITGSAWITQYCTVVIDPDDPFQTGYTVGDIWN
jgi:proline racemase